jgi:hypothetical protein
LNWPALPVSREALLIALNGVVVGMLLPSVFRWYGTDRSYLIMLTIFCLNVVVLTANVAAWLR